MRLFERATELDPTMRRACGRSSGLRTLGMTWNSSLDQASEIKDRGLQAHASGGVQLNPESAGRSIQAGRGSYCPARLDRRGARVIGGQ